MVDASTRATSGGPAVTPETDAGVGRDEAARLPGQGESPRAAARAADLQAAQAATERTARRAFIVLMAGAIVLLGFVIEPLAAALSLAAALAAVLWPLQQALTQRFRYRSGLASGLLVLGVVLAFIGPIVAISAFAVNEASQGIQYVTGTVRSEGVAGLIERMPSPLREIAGDLVQRLPQTPGSNMEQRVERQVNAQGGKAAQAVGAVVAATGSFFFEAAMMLIAAFFLLVHGDALVHWLDHVSPLARGQTRELLREFKKVSYSVIASSIVTAGVQATAALIGYAIAGVRHPVFFGAVTFFVAFIPAIGAGGVCLTAAALLLLTGQPYAALFLALWGVFVVGLADNIVKPYLLKKGMELHGAIVFFSLIGGLLAFGAAGLLIGPLIVALFLALLRIYHRDFGADRPAGAAIAPRSPP